MEINEENKKTESKNQAAEPDNLPPIETLQEEYKSFKRNKQSIYQVDIKEPVILIYQNRKRLIYCLKSGIVDGRNTLEYHQDQCCI